LRGNVGETTRENSRKLAAKVNPWRETERTEILTTIAKAEGRTGMGGHGPGRTSEPSGNEFHR